VLNQLKPEFNNFE